MKKPLADDTPFEVETRQIEGWRRMTDAQKAALITSMSRAAAAMALAGVRDRYPNASAREHFLRLAILTHGRDLARRAYPDIDELGIE